MNQVGTYISSVIEKGFRRLKFRRFGRDDIMTAYLGTAFGEDYVPVNAKIVQIATTNSSDNIVVCTVRKADDTLNKGEKVLYSTDENGNIKTRIYLRNNGDIEVKGNNLVIQDGSDFAVKYSALESEFNELKGKFNDLVTKYNTFAAAYVPGGPATQGLPPTMQQGIASEANITLTKIETIKVP